MTARERRRRRPARHVPTPLGGWLRRARPDGRRDRGPVGARLRGRDRRQRAAAGQARQPRPDQQRLRRRRLAARLHPGRRDQHAAGLDANLPQHCKDATVAIEDERFYKHTGVDYSGDRPRRRDELHQRQDRAGRIDDHDAAGPQPLHRRHRSATTSARSARPSSPASSRPQHSKHWILEQYLNTAPYGTVGGQSRDGRAGRRADLLREERQGPHALRVRRCSPACRRRHPSTTRSSIRRPPLERRNEVLTKMAELGYITEAEADEAKPNKLLRLHARHALHHDPRAVLLRLRQAAADRQVRHQHRPPRRPEGLHDDRPASCRMRRATRSTATLTTPGDPSRRDRLDRPEAPATSARWPAAAATARASSTSPRRASASRDRRSRRWCWSPRFARASIRSTTYNSHPIDIKSIAVRSDQGQDLQRLATAAT